MYKGKTIFAQVMFLINTYEFKKCVNRYKGVRHAIKFTYRNKFMVMNFAQFTDKFRLRDLETILNLCSPDLYRSGIKVILKSTLFEANEKKDWRIYQAFVQVLIRQIKEAYNGQKLRLDLDEIVYTFDGSTIGLCLKLCPWAKFIMREEKSRCIP